MIISSATLVDDLAKLEQADFNQIPAPCFMDLDAIEMIFNHVLELPLLAQGVIIRKVLMDTEGFEYVAPAPEDVTTPRISRIRDMLLTEVFKG